ncbi:tyrosine-protein phosphatase [Chryseosolibacter indicus]|uniref:protein-tyrosine-phosphatase n=1 Tax=Chryseosolibacter indicus TaxID=2782351 RepID=A0ABS5VWD5_9BACT|nr:capsular biosynthesis protein [Chryseosolibacter indicus]
MFSWFKRIESVSGPTLKVDIHSHLLPGLDDGVKTFDESLNIIRHFKELGYSALVTTPHIMEDLYRNTPSTINKKLTELKSQLLINNIDFKVEAAAEYYLDEALMKYLHTNERLLTIKGNYLLFETNFVNEPFNLNEFIFLALTKGYKLILAHPERYLYLYNNIKKAEDLINRGVLFQVNMSSLTGYYSKEAQSTAYKLIDRGWVHWLGSDCHHIKHAELIRTAQKNKYFQKAINLPLLNNSLQ